MPVRLRISARSLDSESPTGRPVSGSGSAAFAARNSGSSFMASVVRVLSSTSCASVRVSSESNPLIFSRTSLCRTSISWVFVITQMYHGLCS